MKSLLFLVLTSLGLTAASQAETMAACSQNICVGQKAYNVSREYRAVEVIAIEPNGNYVLKFLDNGGIGGGWPKSDLALPYGCSNKICVGERFFNINRDYRNVEVVAIEYSGNYVLKFLDNYGVGGGWSRSDLARKSGCGRTFCVGDFALNNKRNYRKVQVIGIEEPGTYVLRFLEANLVGGNWSDSDLSRF